MKKATNAAAAASGKRPATDVDRYLAALPADRRAALERLRRMVRAAAPAAAETVSYHMPVFKHLGMLVGFASFKDHLTFFVMSTRQMKAHGASLKPYATTAGGVHFTVDRPLPAALVRRLVRARVAENEARRRQRLRKKGRRAVLP
jgi:uncharacterized protein YdhG (YjbR/CyaY superfamily)